MPKKTVGSFAKMLNNTNVKHNLRIDAYMSDGNDIPEQVDDTKYLKDDLARCNGTVNAIEKELATWVPEDIAAKVKKQLEANLEREQARVAELKAQLKARKARG